MRNAIKDWWAVILAFGGAVITVIEIISNLFGLIPAPSAFWVNLGVALFFIFGSVAIIQSKNTERKLRAELPKISFSKAYVDERVILIPSQNSSYSSQTGSYPPKNMPSGFDRHETYYFAHITFKNDSMMKTAFNVSAEYEFYNGKLEQIPIYNFYGRWGLEKEQPATRDFRNLPKKEIRIDLPPTGEDYELDIAMKHKSESFCFAFNDTNFSAVEFRKRDFILKHERIFVCVKLRGEKLTLPPFWFELQNLGKDNEVKIKKISPPK